jgi:3-hydroxyacyl-CoA dehydrogenase
MGRDFKKDAVIGAGAMNSGIAHLFAAAFVEVILLDVTTDFVKIWAAGRRGMLQQ